MDGMENTDLNVAMWRTRNQRPGRDALRQRAQNADVKDSVKAIPAQGNKAKGKSEGDKLEDPDPFEA